MGFRFLLAPHCARGREPAYVGCRHNVSSTGARNVALIVCICCADSNDAETVRVAEAMQFQLVDVRVTLERALAIGPPPPASIRSWCESDLATLAAIAGVSHSDSRFYFDGKFPRERCVSFIAFGSSAVATVGPTLSSLQNWRGARPDTYLATLKRATLAQSG